MEGGSARALALALLALALERSLQLAFAHLTAAPVAPAASHWPTALRRRLLRIEDLQKITMLPLPYLGLDRSISACNGVARIQEPYCKQSNRP